MKREFGFREHAHTADWELEVWALNFPGLLEQSARGMYSISGVHLREKGHQVETIMLHADDAESLLVSFLSELLWLEQSRGVAFNKYSIRVDNHYDLLAELEGSVIASIDKEIKAVTYHNMAIEASSQGLRVSIVFDV
jgi:SHS2 domain-containing protein